MVNTGCLPSNIIANDSPDSFSGVAYFSSFWIENEYLQKLDFFWFMFSFSSLTNWSLDQLSFVTYKCLYIIETIKYLQKFLNFLYSVLKWLVIKIKLCAICSTLKVGENKNPNWRLKGSYTANLPLRKICVVLVSG